MADEAPETKEGSGEADSSSLTDIFPLPAFRTTFDDTPTASLLVLSGVAKAAHARQNLPDSVEEVNPATLGDVFAVLEHIAALTTQDASDASDAASGASDSESADDSDGAGEDDEAKLALLAYLSATVATHLDAIDPTGDPGASTLGDTIRVLLETSRIRAAGKAAMQVRKLSSCKLTAVCVHARNLTCVCGCACRKLPNLSCELVLRRSMCDLLCMLFSHLLTCSFSLRLFSSHLYSSPLVSRRLFSSRSLLPLVSSLPVSSPVVSSPVVSLPCSLFKSHQLFMAYFRRIPRDVVFALDPSADNETALTFLASLNLSGVGKVEGKQMQEEGARFYAALRRAVHDRDIQEKMPAGLLASIIALCDRMDCRHVERLFVSRICAMYTVSERAGVQQRVYVRSVCMCCISTRRVCA
jgi:hypothetical protein